MRHLAVVLVVSALVVGACTVAEPPEEPRDQASAAPEAGREDPRAAPDDPSDGPAYLDAALPVAARVEDLLGRMTLDEKLGQMTLVEKDSIVEGDLAARSIGALLSGGGGVPEVNTPESWADMTDAFQAEAVTSRLGIPLLYGVDAVHGHNNVVGATIFPHNIGLGAANDPDLVREIGRATAIEQLATGTPWNYAPVLAVPQDLRWGRTYEGYSDDPVVVGALGTAFLEGLQSVEGPPRVIGTPKHFVADGAAAWGTSRRGDWQIDQGDARIGEDELRTIHLAPYLDVMAAGPRTMMASFSSWNGQKVHGHRYLLTEVLRDEVGFDGLLVSDWGGVDQIDEQSYHRSVVAAVTAGIDLNMIPYDYQRWLDTLGAAVTAGDVPEERIDEAVRRILTVKVEMGLFEQPFAVRGLLPQVGSDGHRALARRAVTASMVPLLGGDLLPLGDDVHRVWVAGDPADDLGIQSGGWTITWQGSVGAITEGTTILEALEARLGVDAEVVHRRVGLFDERAPLGIAVVGERPYAEGEGDVAEPRLPEPDLTSARNLRASVDTLVVIVLSGRPVLLDDLADLADVVVAAWLPGSEGAGVVDGLFGDVPLTGRLPMGWIDDVSQIGPEGSEPWLPRGHPN